MKRSKQPTIVVFTRICKYASKYSKLLLRQHQYNQQKIYPYITTMVYSINKRISLDLPSKKNAFI